MTVCFPNWKHSYGKEYRGIHAEEDLKCLKRHETHLSVSGGEHCGRLYWHMVCLPARGETAAKVYFQRMYDLFNTGSYANSEVFEAEWVLSRLADLRSEILEICDVMIRNYDVYMEHIWPRTKQEIQVYAAPLERMFGESRFTELAERELGTELGSEEFYVVCAASMAGGPEAIDISTNQDVFGMHRDRESAYSFIAHEYIIFLLKEALRDTEAFQSMDTWAFTEGLAEFYLERITGHGSSFTGSPDILAFYRAAKQQVPGLGPIGLYEAARNFAANLDIL